MYPLAPRQGFFRRTILAHTNGDVVEADVEDDFHRFCVAIRHADSKVAEIEAHAIRYPWTTCSAATHQLRYLVGMTLSTAPDKVYRYTDGRYQCTHMLELAGVAITTAARGEPEKLYEIVVSDPDNDRQHATLKRDGAIILNWTVANETIESGDKFGGTTLRALGHWAAIEWTDALAEPALLLRRAVRLSLGRRIDVDAMPTAASLHRGSVCYSYQPNIAPQGLRMKGSHRDFDGSVAVPLRDLIGQKRR